MVASTAPGNPAAIVVLLSDARTWPLRRLEGLRQSAPADLGNTSWLSDARSLDAVDEPRQGVTWAPSPARARRSQGVGGVYCWLAGSA